MNWFLGEEIEEIRYNGERFDGIFFNNTHFIFVIGDKNRAVFSLSFYFDRNIKKRRANTNGNVTERLEIFRLNLSMNLDL